MILVTGGAGFVGLNFIQGLLQYTDETEIVNLDTLLHSSNRLFLPTSPRHIFIQGSIGDKNLLGFILKNKPSAIINFADEGYTDKSNSNPLKLMSTNTNGTYSLLESIREHSPESLFVHVSDDKVFGSLTDYQEAFTEDSPYKPDTPYSATKAASDQLVRAWGKTYNLKTIITHSSSNFGILQPRGKLIPMTITQALKGEDISVHGNGRNIRDWIHVGDHCSAIRFLIKNGIAGEAYNIGANNQMTNISIVHKICQILDVVKPKSDSRSYTEQIKFVTARTGEDYRYALNTGKINTLGWQASKNFNEELTKLVESFVKNV